MQCENASTLLQNKDMVPLNINKKSNKIHIQKVTGETTGLYLGEKARENYFIYSFYLLDPDPHSERRSGSKRQI
jgi:hypothetical protein